jgi:hypothetical protein
MINKEFDDWYALLSDDIKKSYDDFHKYITFEFGNLLALTKDDIAAAFNICNYDKSVCFIKQNEYTIVPILVYLYFYKNKSKGCKINFICHAEKLEMYKKYYGDIIKKINNNKILIQINIINFVIENTYSFFEASFKYDCLLFDWLFAAGRNYRLGETTHLVFEESTKFCKNVTMFYSDHDTQKTTTYLKK